MFTNIKLIIFDLDGTLCDTLIDLTDSVNFSLSKHNLPNKTLEYIKNAIGNGVEVLISRCVENGFKHPKYLEILSDFRTHYLSNYLNKTIPYEGVIDTLISLKEKGYLLTVCTNKLHEAAIEIVNHFFTNLFDLILGSKPSLKKKPDPQMIHFILKELSISESEALYVGDTNVDYEVAKNSNVDLVLVSYGYRKKDFLTNIDRESIVIDKINDLLSYL